MISVLALRAALGVLRLGADLDLVEAPWALATRTSVDRHATAVFAVASFAPLDWASLGLGAVAVFPRDGDAAFQPLAGVAVFGEVGPGRLLGALNAQPWDTISGRAVWALDLTAEYDFVIGRDWGARLRFEGRRMFAARETVLEPSIGIWGSLCSL